jgi:hypothetical protein
MSWAVAGFKLTAAFCYGFGLLPFLVHESQCAGPNLVWTVCWLALSAMRDHYGFWPEELHLTLDNTTGEGHRTCGGCVSQ